MALSALKPPLPFSTPSKSFNPKLRASDGVRQSLDYGPDPGFDATVGKSIAPKIKSARFNTPYSR